MSRERFAASVCEAIWYMLDGFARSSGIAIDYDDPLPFAALTGGPTGGS
jgi:hypothetical protein